jgi:drug/metabolite transporter (DMT)-like permease
MSWQILIAISVIAFSCSVLLQRVLLHGYKTDPIAYGVIFQILNATIVGTYALFVGFKMPDIATLWPYMLIASILFATGQMAYVKALKTVEASIFSILMASSAVWTMAIGFFLFHEQINASQLLGALLIFASIGLLAERKSTIKLDKGTRLGLLAGLLFGLATVAWVYVGKFSDAASWSALSFVGSSTVIIILNPHAVRKMKTFMSGKILSRILLSGILYSTAAVTALLAFQLGSTSVIAPLQQTSLIVTIFLAYLFLGERQRIWHKALAATVCFAGIFLIV